MIIRENYFLIILAIKSNQVQMT